MRFIPLFAAAAALLSSAAALPAPAAAQGGQQPAAIVEGAVGTGDVEFMDYLYEGQTFSLKPGERVDLGYLQSCLEETITGGDVTVGRERSAVTNGIIQRRKIECDGNRLSLSGNAAAAADRSGAMVYRDPFVADVTLYGVSPAVTLPAPGRLVFQRLDRPEPSIELDIAEPRADLSREGVRLAPGGTYRAAAAGGRTVIVKIDPAAAEDAPILARLLRF
jgi:hypothetical protein